VLRPRPLYARLLDDGQPAGGPRGGGGDRRPFGALADIARAMAAIERAAAAQAMVRALGVAPADVTPEALAGAVVAGGGAPVAAAAATGNDAGALLLAAIDTGVLARTALLLRPTSATTPPAFRPLLAAEL